MKMSTVTIAFHTEAWLTTGILAYVDLARAVNDYLELNITDTYEVP